jgi:hypothetical protein
MAGRPHITLKEYIRTANTPMNIQTRTIGRLEKYARRVEPSEQVYAWRLGFESRFYFKWQPLPDPSTPIIQHPYLTSHHHNGPHDKHSPGPPHSRPRCSQYDRRTTLGLPKPSRPMHQRSWILRVPQRRVLDARCFNALHFHPLGRHFRHSGCVGDYTRLADGWPGSERWQCL